MAKCNSRRTVRSLCNHKRSVFMNHELDESWARVESKLEDHLLLQLRPAAPTLKHQHLKQSPHGRIGSRRMREPRSSILSNQRCTLGAGIVVGMAIGETHPDSNCAVLGAGIHLMGISAEDQPSHSISMVRKHPQRFEGRIPNHNSFIIAAGDDKFSVVAGCNAQYLPDMALVILISSSRMPPFYRSDSLRPFPGRCLPLRLLSSSLLVLFVRRRL